MPSVDAARGGSSSRLARYEPINAPASPLDQATKMTTNAMAKLRRILGGRGGGGGTGGGKARPNANAGDAGDAGTAGATTSRSVGTSPAGSCAAGASTASASRSIISVYRQTRRRVR